MRRGLLLSGAALALVSLLTLAHSLAGTTLGLLLACACLSAAARDEWARLRDLEECGPPETGPPVARVPVGVIEI